MLGPFETARKARLLLFCHGVIGRLVRLEDHVPAQELLFIVAELPELMRPLPEGLRNLDVLIDSGTARDRAAG